MPQLAVEGITVTGPIAPEHESILTPEALQLVRDLHRRFDPTRRELLSRRAERQVLFLEGSNPSFLDETRSVREGDWQVADAPADLDDRRVEITGPCDRKMMINALNSGARVFMADLEDSLSPTWDNVLGSQVNLADAVRRNLSFQSPDGRSYELGEELATLLVRPRGWHLTEKNVRLGDEPISASLFDFGLYFFHNAQELCDRGSGPYFYLPKLESHLEARLWNDVFVAAQEALGIPKGTIRATVLIETILASFEMEEILYELREHAAGLNAGRWDYIFSAIKKFRSRPQALLPDRTQVTMTVPFMRAYTELLVKTCHRRGAHAIGGMSAFIPSRRDPEVNERAIQKVREDKEREAGDGFDGTWVAHPDLVPVAREAFDEALGDRPHQKSRTRDDVAVSAEDLASVGVPGGTVSREGVANNVSVALQYLSHWLGGTGAVGIFNLMEDAATAEISRAQLWQWIHLGVPLVGEAVSMSPDLYREIRDQERGKLTQLARLDEAVDLLDRLVLDDSFVDFLTLLAYPMLDR